VAKFGNFLQTAFITVPLGAAFPWNNQGPKSGVKLDPTDNTKIKVKKAGKYKVDFYIVFQNLATGSFYTPIVQIKKNGSLDPRTKFGTQVRSTSGDCLLLTGTAIIKVSNNSTIQLINISNLGGDSSNISTCDSGPVAAAINFVQVS
jgi:hypothetical protein